MNDFNSKNVVSIYDFEYLDEDYQKLLINICVNISRAKRDEVLLIDENGKQKVPEIWDGKIFQEFLMPKAERVEEFKKLLSNFEELTEDKKVSYETFTKIGSDGIGKKAAIKAFSASAKIHNRSITEHLREYDLSRKNEEYYLKGFLGYENTLNRLYSSSPEIPVDLAIVAADGDVKTSVGDYNTGKLNIRKIIHVENEQYIGDAIDIAKFDQSEIYAIVNEPYSSDDEFIGKFLHKNEKERFERWVKGYSNSAIQYIRDRIEGESRKGAEESAKIGFVGYNHDMAASGLSTPLVIRPLNHLVTTAFNSVNTKRLCRTLITKRFCRNR